MKNVDQAGKQQRIKSCSYIHLGDDFCFFPFFVGGINDLRCLEDFYSHAVREVD